jgi:putative sigma-54 modulation protein
MRLQVTVRRGQVNPTIRDYVEAKFRKLERRVHDATLIDVVLDRERNPKIADDHVVEATIHLKGPTLHGRESATSYEAAADLLVDKLERQVERHRDKRVHEPRRRASAAVEPEPVPPEILEQVLAEKPSEESAA